MTDLDNQAVQQWRELMHSYQSGETVLSGVLAEYCHKSRHYHNVLHLAEMTWFLAQNRHLLKHYPEVLFACLYHDVVYDATKNDNEEQSIARWRKDLARLGLSAETTERVANLIMSTMKHQPLDDSADMFLFLDADLSILGSNQARYEEYASAIRREYAHVTGRAYGEGRIAVLKKFLKRPRLYFSAFARACFEEKARQNISAEIERLERAGVHGVG